MTASSPNSGAASSAHPVRLEHQRDDGNGETEQTAHPCRPFRLGGRSNEGGDGRTLDTPREYSRDRTRHDRPAKATLSRVLDAET